MLTSEEEKYNLRLPSFCLTTDYDKSLSSCFDVDVDDGKLQPILFVTAVGFCRKAYYR